MQRTAEVEQGGDGRDEEICRAQWRFCESLCDVFRTPRWILFARRYLFLSTPTLGVWGTAGEMFFFFLHVKGPSLRR